LRCSASVSSSEWSAVRPRRPPRATRIPYTTLCRSPQREEGSQSVPEAEAEAAPEPEPAVEPAPEPTRDPEQEPGPVHAPAVEARSEEHTSELQSRENLVCRLLREKTNELCSRQA